MFLNNNKCDKLYCFTVVENSDLKKNSDNFNIKEDFHLFICFNKLIQSLNLYLYQYYGLENLLCWKRPGKFTRLVFMFQKN